MCRATHREITLRHSAQAQCQVCVVWVEGSHAVAPEWELWRGARGLRTMAEREVPHRSREQCGAGLWPRRDPNP